MSIVFREKEGGKCGGQEREGLNQPSYVAEVNIQFLKQKSQEQYERTIRHANARGEELWQVLALHGWTWDLARIR